MENSELMKQAFFECFSGCAHEGWNDYWGGREARVFVDKDKQVYFRLVPEPGRLYRLEFWVDTYANNRPALHAKLQEIIGTASRKCAQVSHYSGLGCCLRNRITSELELQEDVRSMTALLMEIIKSATDGIAPVVAEANEGVLHLPCSISLEEVSNKVGNGNFKLPPIQRGKVWNAARCATLWDSIMRGFSIGALSIQPKDDGTYDLLDGQQRSTAVCLAYADFPPKNMYDSVLWIDLNPTITDECKYHFYVTTASQPWGYERSTDETRNVKLKTSDIKSVLGVIKEWHNQDEKPYPFELWPVNAEVPVPFSLLRKYIQSNGARATLKGFLGQYESAAGSCWNWLRHVEGSGCLDKTPDLTELFAKIFGIDQFTVQVLDAGNVTESDVALYFTRIGKGGVVPSNEELAYSVLKSKIGGGFREKIEGIVERTGLDRASRVAALAVRYCISIIKDGGGFYTGGVLEKIVECSKLDNTKSETDEPSLIDVVKEFVSGNSESSGNVESLFERLIEIVNAKLAVQGYTNWHITRYCQRHGGAVYQFLLMIAASKKGDSLCDAFDRSGLTLGGIAELLSWYAPNPAHVIRKILAKNDFSEAIAEAMREAHYGSARMAMPITPSSVAGFVKGVLECKEWKEVDGVCANHPDIVNVISSGYGNEAAYSKLIYACNKNRKSEKSLFGFNSNIGVWAEDNCPWDYDHILPHSWVDDLPKVLRAKYAWLVNSIGNLAPIDFSLNRKLSNDARGANYPRVGCSDEDAIRRSQCDCFVLSKRGADDWCFGKLIEAMAMFRNDAEGGSSRAFLESTLRRFSLIYDCWYTSLGVGGLFKIEGGVKERKQNIQGVFKQSEDGKRSMWYYDHNGNRIEFESKDADNLVWFVWQWIECGDIRISRDNKRYKLKGADPLQDDSWCEDVG